MRVKMGKWVSARCQPLTFSHSLSPMGSLNIQPQTLPLDLSPYSFTPPLLSIPVIHPTLLSSFIELKNSKYQPNDVGDPLSSVNLSRTEPNNNDILSAQVSSSRCDSDAATSPSPHRHNVIVKNDSKRKKVSRAANVIIQVSIRELVKDNAYWERRRKNNDAAKRSRDTRRQKEDDMASRAASLEHENLRLRVELEQLRAETDHLRTIMLSPVIKTPVALRQPVIPNQSFLGLPLIAAPSVIKPTESYCNQSLPIQYPDSTQRSTVLVTNLSNS